MTVGGISYEDPARPKTLDEFTARDWRTVALGAGTAPALGAVASSLPSLVLWPLAIGLGIDGMREGLAQYRLGAQQDDAGRMAYGASLGLLSLGGISSALPGRLRARR
jgi:hypothetical protein